MNSFEHQHEAMATTFVIHVAGHPAEYARQAAAAAFRELDRLEGELSVFVESSDIARANRLAGDESITIGDDAWQCLLLAAGVAQATDRAFDPAYATERAAGTPAGAPPFTLDPATHTLTSHVARLHLDLGAIGKGYALDRLGELLGEWNVTRACLHSGGSTVLALAPPEDRSGWPVNLDAGGSRPTLRLAHAALSGSGLTVQGTHLVDPRTGGPAARSTRTWALAPSAALSDALSTAFFVWSDDAIAAFCAAHPEVGAALLTPDGRLVAHAALQELLRAADPAS
ncbi:MAG: FAD:protein FMN transferase [Lacunisphaera sp.]|nr:FAD:protein FMN transferase [Lacunisphaera sp.]